VNRPGGSVGGAGCRYDPGVLTTSTVAPNTRRARANHFVISGFDGLAYRLAEELTTRYGADVVVLMTPEQQRTGRDFEELAGVRVVVVDRLDERAFGRADLGTASGLALTLQDDVGNIHVALRARELAPNQRLVVRMYNSSLGHGIEQLLGNCRVLSDAEIAAPALVAAALGEVAASPLPVAGRVLTVARRSEVPAHDIVCGLANTGDAAGPDLLPADHQRAELVLAELRAPSMLDTMDLVTQSVERQARRWWRVTGVFRAARGLVSRRIRIALTVVLGLLVVAGAVFSYGQHLSVWEGVYATMVNAFGGPQQDEKLSWWLQGAQLLIGIGGLALVPLITAMVVESLVNARIALTQGRLRLAIADHVVVVGLGNVGTRVLRLLHDRGVPVVAIDVNEQARGVQLARELGVPLILADAARETTLRSASVDTCRALMNLASSDVINLEAALHGRNLKPHLRVVVRIFDGDLARRVRRTFDIRLTRSVSYVAAPAFAEALMDRDVIGTIAVERRVLLIADVFVAPGTQLEGLRITEINRPGEVRVIAKTAFGEPRPLWDPPVDHLVAARDRLTVVGTRNGLSRLMRQVEGPPPAGQESWVTELLPVGDQARGAGEAERTTEAVPVAGDPVTEPVVIAPARREIPEARTPVGEPLSRNVPTVPPVAPTMPDVPVPPDGRPDGERR
jgi:Trk K+ transport system NAD-binding subunit